MNIIHIDKVPYPLSNDDRDNRSKLSPYQIQANNQAYYKWKHESEDILGVPHRNLGVLVGGFPPFDFVWIDKALYKRECKHETFFYLTEENSRGVIEEDTPAIICECGSSLFSLKYGNYTCIATCPACKREDIIYEG